MDYIEIASGPAYEKVEQANVPGSNYQRMRAECRAFIGQLRRELGQEPEGASLQVKFFADGNHGYYEVVCYFESDKKLSVDYAFRCEAKSPGYWDEDAKCELANVEVGVQA